MKEKILRMYQSTFDIVRDYNIEGTQYDAYGFCDVTQSKYVLTKKAELWRTLSYDHLFLKESEICTEEALWEFVRETESYIEPKLIRKGEKTMPKDHMASFITGIFISREAVPDSVIKALAGMKFMKNYSFSFRGYSEMRILVLDEANHKIYSNRAGATMVKEYRKIFSSYK